MPKRPSVRRFPFRLVIEGEVEAARGRGSVELKIAAVAGDDLGARGVLRAETTSLDLKMFDREEQADAFVEGATLVFRLLLPVALTEELYLCFVDALNLSANDSGVERVDAKLIIDQHLRKTEERLKKTLGAGTAGRKSQWTALQLTRAIKRALRALDAGEWTYDRVAEKLREFDSDTAPSSGGALRQMIIRLGLNWKQIKVEAKRRE
jgi:hypothetical protein